MKGRFWLVGSFHVRSRNLFVLVGDLLEGKAEPGSSVCVRLGGFGVSARVASLEVIDISYEGRRHLGLALYYDDPEDLDFWSDLRLSNEEIELEDAIETSAAAPAAGEPGG